MRIKFGPGSPVPKACECDAHHEIVKTVDEVREGKPVRIIHWKCTNPECGKPWTSESSAD